MSRAISFGSLSASLVIGACLTACGGGSGGSGGGGPASSALVAFSADLDVDDRPGVYVADADGDVVDVSGPNTLGDGVHDFAWSPDRTRIAFLDDKTVKGLHDIYVVSAGGGTPKLLTGSHPPGFNAFSLVWSPDGKRLLLRGLLDGTLDERIGTIPAAGGAVALLSPSGALPDGYKMFWSPDSSAVAFEGRDGGGVVSYYIAEADGSSTKLVSGPIVAGGSVQNFQGVYPWAADSSRVAFRGDLTTVDKFDVYTVLRDGTGRVDVTTPIGVAFDVFQIEWAPVGARLAFAAQRDASPYDGHVYTTDGTGGALVQVSEPNGSAGPFAWRPDGAKIAYIDDESADTLRLTDPLTGVSTLIASLSGGVTHIADDLRWSPDGSRIAYRAGEPGGANTDDHFRLFVVVPGSAPVLLSTSVFGPAGNVELFKWSPDGAAVAFRCELISGDGRFVYTSPATGGGDAQKTPPGAEGGYYGFGFTSDSSTVVWAEGAATGDYRIVADDATGATPVVDSTPAYTDLDEMQVR